VRIVADENIPFAREAFGTLGHVTLARGRVLSAGQVAGADLLFVRSVTSVGAALLDGSPVRFVGSATAGTDHVDIEYLERRGIAFAAAPGSNANSVGEYMAAAWLAVATRKGVRLDGLTVGIIGAGHTGSAAEAKTRALGMRPVLNDPPLARKTGDPKYRPLDEVLCCDIITCHTPLTRDGPDPTYHLAGEAFFARVKPGAWFCNAGRGEVADSAALRAAIDSGRLGAAILDVWEEEPRIDPDLLQKVDIGTPHIAGYSYDGKVNGTAMVYEAACEFLGVEPAWGAREALPAPAVEHLDVNAAGRPDEEVLHDIVSRVYSVERDDEALRRTVAMAPAERAGEFDRLRKDYPRRREFHTARVRLAGASDALRAKAAGLGFRVEIQRA
jgi:erythronate-4-phosphate dehydrogenase